MRRVAAGFGVILVLCGGWRGDAAARQVDRLPRPTGPFAVGTTVRRWTDSTRLERFTGDPHDHRVLDVYIWYPAAWRSGRSPTPYVPDLDGLERALGSDYVGRVGGVRGNSSVEPALSRQPALFPVVVLSHELGSLPMHYTMLGEELASQGYLVAAANHSYGSAATQAGRRGAQPMHPTWRSALGASAEAQQAWEQGVTEWAADIVFVVNQLGAEHRVTTEFFGGRVDPSRIFAAGHGLGAEAALLAGQIDPRIRGVVGLAGTVRPIHTRFPVNIPVLWVAAEGSPADGAGVARRDTVMARARLGSAVASVAGAVSDHFSDLPVLFGPPPGGGTLAPLRGIDILRTYVVRFLAGLIGQADPGELERLGRRFPEVTLTPAGS